MKNFLFYFFIFFGQFAAAVCAEQTIDFGRYHALVIGNNDYQHLPKLRTAVSDAEAVAHILTQKYGFDVTLQKNARRQDIINAMNLLAGKLSEQDNLLIYYAGHGTLDKLTNTGYWQPVDAAPDNDTFWIPTTDINRQLNRINARHVLVIVDSCYAGSLLIRGQKPRLSVGEEWQTWLLRLLSKGSRTALTSGYLGPVQDVGSGDHSVFADVLLEFLRNNDTIIDGHSLFEQIKRPITIRSVYSDQIPQYADIKSVKHEGGDFFLVPKQLQNMKMNDHVPPNLPAPPRGAESEPNSENVALIGHIDEIMQPENLILIKLNYSIMMDAKIFVRDVTGNKVIFEIQRISSRYASARPLAPVYGFKAGDAVYAEK